MAAAKDWESQITLKDLIIVVYHPQVKNPLPIGPAAFPIAEVQSLAQSLAVERLDHSFGTY